MRYPGFESRPLRQFSAPLKNVILLPFRRYAGFSTVMRRALDSRLSPLSGRPACPLPPLHAKPHSAPHQAVGPSDDRSSRGASLREYPDDETTVDRRHALLKGFDVPEHIQQIAVFFFASNARRKAIGGGKIVLVGDILAEMVEDLGKNKIAAHAVPETFPLLRTVQFVTEFRVNCLQSEQARNPSCLSSSTNRPLFSTSLRFGPLKPPVASKSCRS